MSEIKVTPEGVKGKKTDYFRFFKDMSPDILQPYTLEFRDADIERGFKEYRGYNLNGRLRFALGVAIMTSAVDIIVSIFHSRKLGADDTEADGKGSLGFCDPTLGMALQFVGPIVALLVSTVMLLSASGVRIFKSSIQHNVPLRAFLINAMLVCNVVDASWGPCPSSTNTSGGTWSLLLQSFLVGTCASLPFLTTVKTLAAQGLVFVVLTIVAGVHGEQEAADIAGVVLRALMTVLCSCALTFFVEVDEREVFSLISRLATDNIKVNLQMEMTGWFGDGAEDEKQASLLEAGVQSTGVHIDHRQIELKEELGAGAFGVVYKGIWKGTQVAVKKLTIDEGSIQQEVMREFGAEASVMAELRHPHIVNFMGVILHPEFMGLMMEFCPKGTMYNIIHEGNYSAMDWSLTFRLLIDSACGMNFLHQHVPSIIHRDLKSLNILVSADWRGKIADFGLSALKELVDPAQEGKGQKQKDNKVVGSLVWCAPEVFMEMPPTEGTDVFAFGVIVYECLTKSLPYADLSQESIPYVVQKGKRPTDFGSPLDFGDSTALKRLVRLMHDCWHARPQARPNFSKIMETLTICVKECTKHEDDWEEHIVYPDRRHGNPVDDMMDQFTIEEKDLDIGGAIGKGMFGAVYKGTYFGTKVAIKKLFISGIPADTLAEFNKECAIMKQLRHPNIVLFMGSCCQPPSLLLVTELLERGSFFDIYHKSSQPVSVVDHLMLALNIAIDMCKGMGYLHNISPPVIHRDLKSQNIMLDEKWTTKIGDFGLSRFKDAGKTMSMCGSPLWVAPEVLRGEKYGVGCDIFSFSIIMWETLAWSEPYPDMSSNDVMSGIASGTLRPQQPAVCPQPIFALLEEAWAEDPEMRPHMEEMVFRFDELKEKVKNGRMN